jgi:hypothetical protein
MLELRTLFISSTLAAEAGIFSRAETAKQNQKLEFGLTKVHRFSDKTYMFGLFLETKN